MRIPSSAIDACGGRSSASSSSSRAVIIIVCSTLVGMLGSSRRASAWAAIDSSSRPQ
jgi:hypothetical protein